MRDIEKDIYEYKSISNYKLDIQDKAILITIFEELEVEFRRIASQDLNNNLVYEVALAHANGVTHAKQCLRDDVFELHYLKEVLMNMQSTVLLGLDLPRSKMNDFIRIWHELPSRE